MLDVQQMGEALPSYQIGGELGRGGWGVVLAAHHRQLGRDVAIKQLPRGFAADPEVLARFTAEARVLASLDHPHIVPVYDFVERDGLCLIVMESLPGGTVWERFISQGLTPKTACALVLATAAGLHAAHARGILHRDIKPENLMFSATGALKVTDFGIAKVVGGESTLATRAGEVVGTPAYMAPEQAQGGSLSPATDLYAVCTMLYELLSGSLPFEEDGDALSLLFKHAYEKPVPLLDKAPFLPAPVSQVVMRGLETEPTDRFATAEEFALALAEACTTAWGPGWLDAEGVPLMGSARVLAETERTKEANPLPGSTAPVGATTIGTLPVDADTVLRRGDGRPAVTESSPHAAATRGAGVMRPSISIRAPKLALEGIVAGELVPVQDVMPPPPGASTPAVAAIVLVLVMVALALVGIGKPAVGGGIPRGTVVVQGSDPSAGAVVPIDLTRPIDIHIATRDPADQVRLALSLLGRQVVTDVADISGGSAVIDASNSRLLLGGRTTGELTFSKSGRETSHEQFGVKLHQPSVLTAPGVLDIAMFLIVLAYGESLLRALRRGRRLVSATVGLTIVGAVLGCATVGLAWIVVQRQPTLATVVGCVIVGGLAGISTGAAGARIGRRRRPISSEPAVRPTRA